MKSIIFSDIHINSHKKSIDRLEDCIEVLDWVFKSAIEKNVNNIIFLGDLFHDRQKIDVLTYHKTYEILEKHLLKNEINLYLLLGNHDLWHYEKTDVSSVNPFRNLPGVQVIDKPCVKKISDDYLFAFLPFTHNPLEDLKQIEKEWKLECKKNKIDPIKILGGHIAVDGAVWNVKYGTFSEVAIEHDGDMIKIGSNVFSYWEKVFLGHYHAEQKLSNKVEYVGSPLQLNFGEAFQKKHIVLYDFSNNEIEYIDNNFSPKHYIISENDLEKYDLKGNFIRLEVDDVSSSTISEVRKNLIENKEVASMEIKQAAKKEQEHSIVDAKSILSKEDEMLEKYLEQVNVDLDKKRLLEIGKSIIE